MKAAVLIDGGYLQKSVQAQWHDLSLDLLKFSEEVVSRARAGERIRTYYYDCPPYRGEPPSDEEKRRTANFDRFKQKLERLPRFSYRAGRLQRYQGLPPRCWYRTPEGNLIEICVLKHPDTDAYDGFAVQRQTHHDPTAQPPRPEGSIVVGSVTGHPTADSAVNELVRSLQLPPQPEHISTKGQFRFDQKRVDMLLGIDLVQHASKKAIDHAILVTGDSDFIPAVEMARQEGVVITLVHSEWPKQRPHQELYQICDERIPLTPELVNACRLAAPGAAPAATGAALSVVPPQPPIASASPSAAQPATSFDALLSELKKAEGRLPYVGARFFSDKWIAQPPMPPGGAARAALIAEAARAGVIEFVKAPDGNTAIKRK